MFITEYPILSNTATEGGNTFLRLFGINHEYNVQNTLHDTDNRIVLVCKTPSPMNPFSEDSGCLFTSSVIASNETYTTICKRAVDTNDYMILTFANKTNTLNSGTLFLGNKISKILEFNYRIVNTEEENEYVGYCLFDDEN